MSCSPFDLRDYLFNELAQEERRQMDQHVRSCGGCHEELERLRITQTTLLALREEEVPQRIGFVSDKVFEPSPARRVWQAFWGSSAKLGFASAAMLSAALVFFTFFRQAPAVASVAPLVRYELKPRWRRASTPRLKKPCPRAKPGRRAKRRRCWPRRNSGLKASG